MKFGLECVECLIHRAYVEIQKATKDQELRKEALIKAVKKISENLDEDAVPAGLGTLRDRIIRQVTQNSDPYKIDKILSNEKALELFPSVEKHIAEGKESSLRLRRACLASIVGNAIEFGILGYEFNFDNLEEEIIKAESNLAIDDIAEMEKRIRKSNKILFLTDNAGEIIFDRLLISEIKSIGPKVIVAVKGAPVSNDATIEDAKKAGIISVADKVITTGGDASGFIPEYCTKDFLEVFYSCDFIVAKGMAHLETLTEYEPIPPRTILLRAKCKPVSKYLNVGLKNNVAKLFDKEWHS